MRFWTPKSFPRGRPLVSLVVASYLGGADGERRADALTCLLFALKAQTYKNWEALVVHDGPDGAGLAHAAAERADDRRVRLWAPSPREGKFGHTRRHAWASGHASGAYVGFLNDDVYLAPVTLEAAADRLVNEDADFVYWNLVHSHQHWQPFETKARKHRIDVNCFLASRSLVAQTPWTDFSFNGDGAYVDALVAKARRVVKLKGYYTVHN